MYFLFIFLVGIFATNLFMFLINFLVCICIIFFTETLIVLCFFLVSDCNISILCEINLKLHISPITCRNYAGCRRIKHYTDVLVLNKHSVFFFFSLQDLNSSIHMMFILSSFKRFQIIQGLFYCYSKYKINGFCCSCHFNSSRLQFCLNFFSQGHSLAFYQITRRLRLWCLSWVKFHCQTL